MNVLKVQRLVGINGVIIYALEMEEQFASGDNSVNRVDVKRDIVNLHDDWVKIVNKDNVLLDYIVHYKYVSLKINNLALLARIVIITANVIFLMNVLKIDVDKLILD